MAAIYLPENKLQPFVTQTQNEMHLKGKGSATGTMEIVLGMEKQEHLRVNVAPDQLRFTDLFRSLESSSGIREAIL